jgi:hypothetical protein
MNWMVFTLFYPKISGVFLFFDQTFWTGAKNQSGLCHLQLYQTVSASRAWAPETRSPGLFFLL